MGSLRQLGPRPSLAPSIISFGEVVGSQRALQTPVRDSVSLEEQGNGKFGEKRRHINSCFHQYRFIIAQLGGFAVGLMLFHRYSMTIAILPMVNQTHLYLVEHPNRTLQDFLDEGFVPGGEFNWNNEIVAIILGWYMFSYTLPQTLAAKWNITIGCRLATPIGLTLCAVSNILTPSFAYLGWRWVVACRLLNGFGAAGILPGLLTLLEDWLRYDEISFGLTTGTSVFAVMVALCPLISGYLASFHWSVAFYVPGLATLIFNIIWIVLVTDKPHSNWLVSERELNYLDDQEKTSDLEKSQDCVQGSEGEIEKNPSDGLDDKPDSWVQIFKLPIFYAYLVIWILDCVASSAFTFILPLYMRQFLKIPITENGFYCAIIQSGFLLAVLWPHPLLRLLSKMNCSITQARLISQALCAFIMAGTFVYVGTFHQHQLFMFFLNRCALTGDIIMTGSVMSNFAKAGLSSLFFAIINTVGNLSLTGVSPLIGRWLDFTGSSPWGWKMLFYALSLSQIILLIIFWLFIDSEPIKFKNKSKEEPMKVAQ